MLVERLRARGRVLGESWVGWGLVEAQFEMSPGAGHVGVDVGCAKIKAGCIFNKLSMFSGKVRTPVGLILIQNNNTLKGWR